MKIIRGGVDWRLEASRGTFCLRYISFQAGYRVKDICRLTECAERTLHKTFIRDIGLSPKEWLSAERMVIARRLLSCAISPHLVAEKLGFSNLTNFRREFIRVHGVLPAKFQKDCITPLESYPPPPGQFAPDIR